MSTETISESTIPGSSKSKTSIEIAVNGSVLGMAVAALLFNGALVGPDRKVVKPDGPVAPRVGEAIYNSGYFPIVAFVDQDESCKQFIKDGAETGANWGTVVCLCAARVVERFNGIEGVRKMLKKMVASDRKNADLLLNGHTEKTMSAAKAKEVKDAIESALASAGSKADVSHVESFGSIDELLSKIEEKLGIRNPQGESKPN